eukprot:SAG31_NODE_2469_length_5650_cov_2.117636_5_plen_127_part_00
MDANDDALVCKVAEVAPAAGCDFPGVHSSLVRTADSVTGTSAEEPITAAAETIFVCTAAASIVSCVDLDNRRIIKKETAGLGGRSNSDRSEMGLAPAIVADGGNLNCGPKLKVTYRSVHISSTASR